jgi:hypothetical protein
VDLVCNHLSRRVGTGEFVDLHSILVSFAADVLSAYVLGRENCYGYLDRAEVTDEWKKTVNSLFEALLLVRHVPSLLGLAHIFPKTSAWLFPPFIG